MRMKLEVENVFKLAVGLEQEGRQKNTIFCHGTLVYILNADKTVLIRAVVPQIFEKPIGFFANDYEGDEFRVEDDAIVFITSEDDEDGRLKREKYCRVPSETIADAEAIYQKFWTEDYIATMSFRKKSLAMFDSSLSHIEFLSKDKEPLILQRDIYSGSVIKLSQLVKESGLGFSTLGNEFKEDFGPLGMRTNDFFTLFALDEEVRLNFLPADKKYFIAKGMNHDWVAIVSGCLYDQVGEIYRHTIKEEEDGREIPENGDNVEEAGGTTEKKSTSCRKRT